MARNSYSQIAKLDNTYATLSPYMQETPHFQDFKSEMAKIAIPKPAENYNFEQRNTSDNDDTTIKHNSDMSTNKESWTKYDMLSDFSKQEVRRLKKILKN